MANSISSAVRASHRTVDEHLSKVSWKALAGVVALAFLFCARASPQKVPALPLTNYGASSPYMAGASVPVALLSTSETRLSEDTFTGEESPSEAALVVLAPTRRTESKPEVPAANPGRPSMSTSAALVPMGYAQFEIGVLYAADSAEFESRIAPEQTLRFTPVPRFELVSSFEPTAFSTTGQDRSCRSGDVTGGLQVLLANGHGPLPTLAIGYSRLIKGGSNSGLDIGGYAQGVLLMASSDFGRFHVDANLFLNEQKAGSLRRGQLGQFIAVSHPLTSKLGIGAEFRQFTQPFQGTHGIGLMLAPTYTLRPNLVVDAGVARGLTSTSTHWQAVAGVTYLLPRRERRGAVR